MPQESPSPPSRGQLFAYADELGPVKVVQLYDPPSGMRGILVIDNVAAGFSIGGVRMAPDVTEEEVARLARAMTFKSAAAGLPFGGGKSAILADPGLSGSERERVVRAFARAIGPLTDYWPGPDIGTSERDMAIIFDEIGRATCLPRALGGLPVDEMGVTGYGVVVSGRVAARHAGLDLRGARVAIQGYGNVGRAAAEFFAKEGAVLVAASDIHGAGTGTGLERDAVIGADCDILVPAARPDVVTMSNVDQVRARLIVQGANIPIERRAEEALHQRGVLSIPDFIANAGGLICISAEIRGLPEAQAWSLIEEKIEANTQEVLDRAEDASVMPREAAETMALARVRSAMELRGR